MFRKKAPPPKVELACSFCGKGQHQVRKLIAGPSVYICDGCIGLCNDIIVEEVGPTADATGVPMETVRRVVGQMHRTAGELDDALRTLKRALPGAEPRDPNGLGGGGPSSAALLGPASEIEARIAAENPAARPRGIPGELADAVRLANERLLERPMPRGLLAWMREFCARPGMYLVGHPDFRTPNISYLLSIIDGYELALQDAGLPSQHGRFLNWLHDKRPDLRNHPLKYGTWLMRGRPDGDLKVVLDQIITWVDDYEREVGSKDSPTTTGQDGSSG